MADLLVGHVFDEELLLGGDAGSLEFFGRKLREATVEEVEFEVLLIESE